MIERDLNARHIRGLFHLARHSDHSISIATLHKRVGRYSSNTVKSLEDRGLITLQFGHAQLTPHGHDVVRQLLRDFGISEQFSIERSA